MKPTLKPDDAIAYARVKSLPVGAAVRLGNKPAKFIGMTGNLITLKVGRRNVYLRAGEAQIKEITF